MAAQRFFAKLAKYNSLSFSSLDDDFGREIEKNFENSKFDLYYKFQKFLRRFQIKEVKHETVKCLLFEFLLWSYSRAVSLFA